MPSERVGHRICIREEREKEKQLRQGKENKEEENQHTGGHICTVIDDTLADIKTNMCKKKKKKRKGEEKKMSQNIYTVLTCMCQVEDLLVAMEKVKQELEVMKAKLSSTQLSLAEKEGHLTSLRAERRKHLEEVLEMK